jgi:hypothetical protein
VLRAVTKLRHMTMINPWERGLEVVRIGEKIQFILVRRLYGQRRMDRLVTEVDDLNLLREELNRVSRNGFGFIDLTEIDEKNEMMEERGIMIKKYPDTARVWFPSSKGGVSSLHVSWRGFMRVLRKRLAS